MKYIYGPVKSRRLGDSLGLSLIPHKTCNFDCVYCQLGKTAQKTQERRDYIKIDEILAELNIWLCQNKAAHLDYISLSGCGEPTLNLGIGELISRVKQVTPIPVAVITNSSLLVNSEIRKGLLAADLIVPSLDAAKQEVFDEVDRPIIGVKVEDIINGLIALRKEFRGKIWLEVMLIKGVNDDIRLIKRLKEAADNINPDKIQLNSPIRTTAEVDVLAVADSKLKKIKEILGEKCEVL